MQALISTYFSVVENLWKLGAVERKDRSQWLDNVMMLLESFEWRANRDIEEYATRFPASNWALSVVPPWVAAGMAAGIRPDANVQNAATLYTFCGLDGRRYPKFEDLRDAFNEIVGDVPEDQITDDHIRELAKRADRRPELIGTKPSKQEIFKWVTKRRYSEFLRNVSVQLGNWIQRNKQNAYRKAYEDVLEQEANQAMEHGQGTALSQLQAYAQKAAVRRFLSDYFAAMKKDLAA